MFNRITNKNNLTLTHYQSAKLAAKNQKWEDAQKFINQAFQSFSEAHANQTKYDLKDFILQSKIQRKMTQYNLYVNLKEVEKGKATSEDKEARFALKELSNRQLEYKVSATPRRTKETRNLTIEIAKTLQAKADVYTYQKPQADWENALSYSLEALCLLKGIYPANDKRVIKANTLVEDLQRKSGELGSLGTGKNFDECMKQIQNEKSAIVKELESKSAEDKVAQKNARKALKIVPAKQWAFYSKFFDSLSQKQRQDFVEEMADTLKTKINPYINQPDHGNAQIFALSAYSYLKDTFGEGDVRVAKALADVGDVYAKNALYLASVKEPFTEEKNKAKGYLAAASVALSAHPSESDKIKSVTAMMTKLETL